MAESDTVDSRGSRPGTATDTAGVVEVALLDRSGVIVSVNDAWSAFAEANGGDPDRTGVGVSYLQVCARVPDDPFARRVASAVRTALGGGLPAPVQVELPCHAPDASRWFDVLVSSRFDDTGACLGATVTLSPVAAGRGHVPPQVPGGDEAVGPAVPVHYADPSERLTDVFAMLVLERAPLAILVVDDHGAVVRAGRAAEQLFGHGPDGLTGLPVRRLLPDVDPFDLGVPGAAPTEVLAGATVLTDAVLADGSAEPVEVRLSRLPLSRGTGTLLLVRRASPDPVGSHPDRVVFLGHELDEVVRSLDEVMRHVFNSGLTVTGTAAARRSDRALATTLMGVTEDLDRAAREIRSIGYLIGQYGRRTAFVRSSDPEAPDGPHRPDAPEGPDD
jgi:PAS domain S-box-containing protein